MKTNLSKILEKGKAMYLAYDQGLEHGPIEFNDRNVDPKFIINIAAKGKFTGIVFQKGIAEKYSNEIKKSKVPLILKLNGKTNLFKGEPISAQIATIEEARKLGAAAVGFTIYVGSQYETKMIEQFEKIEKEAHSLGIPVIAWIYPRGKSIYGKNEKELMAYACRVGLELGADIVKIHWNENLQDLKWATKSAGKCKVVIAGGLKVSEGEFLSSVREAMKSEIVGIAVGRNIWQAVEPLAVAKRLKEIIWK